MPVACTCGSTPHAATAAENSRSSRSSPWPSKDPRRPTSSSAGPTRPPAYRRSRTPKRTQTSTRRSPYHSAESQRSDVPHQVLAGRATQFRRNDESPETELRQQLCPLDPISRAMGAVVDRVEITRNLTQQLGDLHPDTTGHRSDGFGVIHPNTFRIKAHFVVPPRDWMRQRTWLFCPRSRPEIEKFSSLSPLKMKHVLAIWNCDVAARKPKLYVTHVSVFIASDHRARLASEGLGTERARLIRGRRGGKRHCRRL
jgi:hypothetical protein